MGLPLQIGLDNGSQEFYFVFGMDDGITDGDIGGGESNPHELRFRDVHRKPDIFEPLDSIRDNFENPFVAVLTRSCMNNITTVIGIGGHFGEEVE